MAGLTTKWCYVAKCTLTASLLLHDPRAHSSKRTYIHKHTHTHHTCTHTHTPQMHTLTLTHTLTHTYTLTHAHTLWSLLWDRTPTSEWPAMLPHASTIRNLLSSNRVSFQRCRCVCVCVSVHVCAFVYVCVRVFVVRCVGKGAIVGVGVGVQWWGGGA